MDALGRVQLPVTTLSDDVQARYTKVNLSAMVRACRGIICDSLHKLEATNWMNKSVEELVRQCGVPFPQGVRAQYRVQ